VEDTWVEGVVNAIAPAGTAYVRVSLFFIQLNNQGGASWFDDVSLVKLTPNVVQLDGDFNMDGSVDAADFVTWRKNNMSMDDYNLWRTNFGRTSGSGANSAVPELGSGILILFGLFAGGCCRRRPTLSR
jgi:hypothetical protein